MENYLSKKSLDVLKEDIVSFLLNGIPHNEKKKKIKILDMVINYCKVKFGENSGKVRDSGESYFLHLQRVVEIIMYEFPNPNFEKVILAFLHDSKEEGCKDLSLQALVGKEVLKKIEILSKLDLSLVNEAISLYKLDDSVFNDYQMVYNRFKNDKEFKKRLYELYFKRLLNCKDENIIDVKLADRIDNLRTIGVWESERIRNKIEETRKYILPLAEKYNLKAKELLLKEITKIEQSLNLSNNKQ